MVRFELRRAETVCSLAITYQHDLARPKLELIQPYAHKAFELLEAWVESGIAPPPSQCVQRGGAIVEKPPATECKNLLELERPISNGPSAIR